MPAPRRALTQEELTRTKDSFDSIRDKLLFVLGVATGYRISELLSLKMGDVFEDGKPKAQIAVPKKSMKQKRAGRTCWLHPEAQAVLADFYRQVPFFYNFYLFHGRYTPYKPLSRQHALRILKAGFKSAGVEGLTGAHSLRKTYAQDIFTLSGNNMRAAQLALGHADMNSTAKYLESADEELKRLITTRKLF